MSEYAVLPVLLLLALHPLQRITQGFLSYTADLSHQRTAISELSRQPLSYHIRRLFRRGRDVHPDVPSVDR